MSQYHRVTSTADSSGQPASVSGFNHDRGTNDEHEVGRHGSMLSRSLSRSNAAPMLPRALCENDNDKDNGSVNGNDNGNDAGNGDVCDDVHDTTGYVSMHDDDAE